MKNNKLKFNETSNFTFFISLVGSLFLAITSVFGLFNFVKSIYFSPIFYDLLRNLKYTFGVFPIVVVTLSVLILFYYYVIKSIVVSRQKLLYVELISKDLEEISQGNFDVKIPIKFPKGLGKLASNINKMSEELKNSIEEERNAEKTKNELVTGVSHDLRTPLTSIIGYLDLINDDKYKDEVELRYYVDIAYNKSIKLKKLIDDLFEFTKINYGGIKMNKTKINIGELLEQLIEEFYPILSDANMKCIISKSDEKLIIDGDGGLLVRAFENVIINAIRYGKEGKIIEINIKNNGNEIIVSIKNYGNPIPQNELPFIFERFYRVEKSRNLVTGGAGLGLAIAKNIVELHNGDIKASSDEQSTTFTFSFSI